MAYSYQNPTKYDPQGFPSNLKNSQSQQNQPGTHITSLQCSAVRENINSDHMLGASEVSWLDQIDEQHEGLYDPSGLQRTSTVAREKSTNQMKFSFNANEQQFSEPEPRRPGDWGNHEHSLKEIYYQEFQKQASRIKDVQQARKAMLDSLNQKQKTKKNTTNKENLVGSIRRFNQDDRTKGNTTSKIQYATHNEGKKSEFERANREEQELSLKYLQQSLAKKNVGRIPLSKLSYLEESEANKEISASKVFTANVKVKQFDERETQFDRYLGVLFEQLDGKKLGKIYRQNCQYEKLNDELKIGFGQIFAKLIFKDHILNKLDFVLLAHKVLRRIDSLHFNSLVTAIGKQIDTSEGNLVKKTQRLDQTIKRNHNYGAQYQQAIVPNLHLQAYQAKQTQALIAEGVQPTKQYNSVPTFRQTPQERNGTPLMSNPKEVASRLKSQLYKLQRLPKNEAEEMLAKYNQSYLNLQRNQQLCKEYLLSLHSSHPLTDIPPAIRKKIRNISEEMIREHKHNLQILTKLNNLMENCLSVSRRKIQSFSCEKYQTVGQSSLEVEKLRRLEWPSAAY